MCGELEYGEVLGLLGNIFFYVKYEVVNTNRMDNTNRKTSQFVCGERLYNTYESNFSSWSFPQNGNQPC